MLNEIHELCSLLLIGAFFVALFSFTMFVTSVYRKIFKKKKFLSGFNNSITMSHPIIFISVCLLSSLVVIFANNLFIALVSGNDINEISLMSAFDMFLTVIASISSSMAAICTAIVYKQQKKWHLIFPPTFSGRFCYIIYYFLLQKDNLILNREKFQI